MPSSGSGPRIEDRPSSIAQSIVPSGVIAIPSKPRERGTR
jgi:hypothetical protein